jgi:hypothetical protein
MDAPAGGCVLAADHGQVRVLTLNRPATRNAIDLELLVVLAEAIEGAGSEAGAGRGRDRGRAAARPGRGQGRSSAAGEPGYSNND